MWPKENIPDDASLFMRIHKTFITGGDVGPHAFRDHGRGLSVDWNEYSTPQETRSRARTPADNAVIGLVAGAVRAIEALMVEHEPIQENAFDEKGHAIKPNRAHSEILGDKTPEIRVKLSRLWNWQIRLGEQ